jgi:hypothetical protein
MTNSTKHFKTFEEIPQPGKCPICGSDLQLLMGEQWDWDHAVYSRFQCSYDIELDTMTCTECDGYIQFIKEKEND